MSTNTKLAEALRRCEACTTNDAVGRQARDALASYDAEQAWESDPTSDAFKAGMAAMEYAIWDGKEPCPCRKQAAKAVPAGWKPVPEEPTLEMLTAAGKEDDKAFIDGMPHGATAADTWTAMLDAAPTPPAPEAQQPAGQEQDERDAFEAWAISYSTIPLKQDDDASLGFTGYTEMDQTMLWDAWQARAALAQRREPLTASQVNELCDECGLDWHRGWAIDEEPNRYLELARAIEKHHGIGATTGQEPGND